MEGAPVLLQSWSENFWSPFVHTLAFALVSCPSPPSPLVPFPLLSSFPSPRMNHHRPVYPSNDPRTDLTPGMDLGRNRCYNCGGVGHIAADCTSPRMEKACFHCGNVGHLAQDCRTPASPMTRSAPRNDCYRCGRAGHIARECRFPATDSSSSGAFGAGRVCYKCQQTGHLAKECPNPETRTCRRCNMGGHIARDCPASSDSLTCYQCQQVGHMAKDCPNPRV